MVRRRIACVGDTLSNGGKVLPYAGHPCLFHGNQVALIGGDAFCEACKSVGKIAKTGGSRRINFMGETAADGDMVLCKCPIPPRIIATLSGNSWCEDEAHGEGVGPAMIPNYASNGTYYTSADEEIIEQYFELVKAETGESLPDFKYDLYLDSKRVIANAPFAQGRTISATKSGALEIVCWQDTVQG